MKKIFAILMAAAIAFSLTIIPVSAVQVVGTPFAIDSTNFTVDNQIDGDGNPTSDASIKDGGIFDVGTLASIPRLVSKENVGKDLDISFKTLLSSTGSDWRFMMIIRDQDPGKASWEGRAKTSGYNIFFGNGAIGIKYADLSDLPTAVSYNAEVVDGNIHTVRVRCVTEADGVHIDLYIDDLKTPVASAVDNSANKVDADGKITFVCHVVNGLSGTFSNMEKITEYDIPDLTESAGTVDLFSEGYSNVFLKYGQGAYMEDDTIHLLPISPTELTNSRFYLDAVQAKDATYNMTMKITNAADAQGWLAMIVLRDQMPGYASWERGAAASVAESSGYMVFLNSTTQVSVVYLHKNNPNGEAIDNNVWTVPESFDWSASHVWSLGVAEIAGKTTITVKVDGETKIAAVDNRTNSNLPKVLTAGGFTTVIHGDNNTTTADITGLTVDLTNKSSEETTSEPEPTSGENPQTGDSFPAALAFAAAILMGGALLAYRKLQSVR